MSYQYRFSSGPYASHCYLSTNGTEFFTFQLDYGCRDNTHFDIYHNNKWSSVTNISELSGNVKELFILAANHTISKLHGYSGISDKALIDLQQLL